MAVRSQGTESVAAAARAAASAIAVGSSAIIDGLWTVDALPAPVDCLDHYARVSDLFGSKQDLVLASRVGDTAFWQPVRPVFAATRPVTADVALMPLKSPSVIFLTGTVGTGVTRTLTLGTTLAYPGASFEIRNDMTGLGAVKVAGLNVGGLLSLVFGGTQRFFYDAASGWKQFS